MQKKASDLKKGDKLSVGGADLIVESIEVSDIGKQGTKKCRISAKKSDGERIVIIRPADYPFNCK